MVLTAPAFPVKHWEWPVGRRAREFLPTRGGCFSVIQLCAEVCAGVWIPSLGEFIRAEHFPLISGTGQARRKAMPQSEGQRWNLSPWTSEAPTLTWCTFLTLPNSSSSNIVLSLSCQPLWKCKKDELSGLKEYPKFKNSAPDGLKWQEMRPVNSIEVIKGGEKRLVWEGDCEMIMKEWNGEKLGYCNNFKQEIPVGFHDV